MRLVHCSTRLQSAARGTPSGSPPACSIAATTSAGSRASSAIAESAFVPLIAVNDVLYHAPERRPLQDVMTCIREHVTIDTAGRLLEANAERHLKPPQEMARLFRRAPEAIDRTLRFLDRCNFSLERTGETEYPDETRVGYATPQEALVALPRRARSGAIPMASPESPRRARSSELEIIGELKYAPYFLTVHDIVNFARSEGHSVPGPRLGGEFGHLLLPRHHRGEPREGRPAVRTLRLGGAQEPPDIDVDFEHERREEVIQYIYKKYGRDHAGLTATVICYRGRSAIREVGKAFGLSDDTVGALAGTLWGWSQSGVKDKEARRAGLDPSDPRLNR